MGRVGMTTRLFALRIRSVRMLMAPKGSDAAVRMGFAVMATAKARAAKKVSQTRLHLFSLYILYRIIIYKFRQINKLNLANLI